MKKQALNPYLPSYEYIPDGEPHVFGDRVYVYGSHDRFNGGGFCMNDYITWSAPVDDLSDWRYEGVIYKKTDDPHYKGRGSMYAPDVCRAPDGSIKQVEMTSCGLNGGPLEGSGEYEARIACNLTSRKGGRFHSKPFGKNKAGCHPYFTQSGGDREGDGDQHIANFCNGAMAGFKYFNIKNLRRIGVTVRGNAEGIMYVRNEPFGAVVAEIAIHPTASDKTFYGEYGGDDGKKALYFTFEGKGKIDKFTKIVLERG